MSPAARPPYSSGHDTTDHRASNIAFSHTLWAAKPSAVSSDGSGPLPLRSDGTCASSQARASARKASSSGVNLRSIVAIGRRI